MPAFETLPVRTALEEPLPHSREAIFRTVVTEAFAPGLGQAHVIWRRIGTHAIFTPPPGR